ncbi:FxLYD domain-containing protein [Bordetella petrii]|uniref:Exported protein n=1 Tax=Bordetella petrii (strain ATCC BAA-461 / DSM 12804 / CCUG 43448 / CIP 107267 / Se-1111R) TaxID=340100 RepID=A9IEQ1_BORPD|nr:FxLYD domain-containing protein [Bordetella petrii]CAP44885.1 putative exported protein [Bordetella petrii]
MKKILATLALASVLAAATAAAQSLPYGVSISNLAATRQADGSSVITGVVSNHGDKPVQGLSVTFVLYDAQGREVGRATGRRDTALAPGETWQVLAPTPHAFTRFTALDIKAQ